MARRYVLELLESRQMTKKDRYSFRNSRSCAIVRQLRADAALGRARRKFLARSIMPRAWSAGRLTSIEAIVRRR